MEEEPTGFFKPPSKPTLKFDDAVRFFKAIAPDARCGACNAKSWEIPISEEEDTICLLVNSGMNRADEVVYNLYIECRNCGWIRGHRIGVIHDWLKKNPEESTADE